MKRSFLQIEDPLAPDDVEQIHPGDFHLVFRDLLSQGRKFPRIDEVHVGLKPKHVLSESYFEGEWVEMSWTWLGMEKLLVRLVMLRLSVKVLLRIVIQSRLLVDILSWEAKKVKV